MRSRFPSGTMTGALVTGVLAGRRDLGAAAQLLYGFCFDRVELETPRLSYEPRWSCQCRKDCAAVWIASKSGAVMHIALATPTGRPEQRWFPGDRAVRTIYHVHDGTALGGGSFLLIGRDKGALDIVSDRDPAWTPELPRQHGERSRDSIHLDSWWTRRDAVMIGERSEHPRSDGPEYTTGVTAIAAFPRPGRPTTLDIVVATRHPWLYVIEAESGMLRLRQRLAMPGWIEWIIGPPDDDRITCISRGGDIVRFSYDELLAGDDGQRTELSFLPTAAMPFGDGSLLLGTRTGMFLVSDDRPEGISVPVTRSPIVCLDHVVVDSDGDCRDYVAMGLVDGRLRIVDAELLRSLAEGRRRPDADSHSFSVELGDAVLAIETLRPDAGPRDAAYVVAVLRDHSVRLFRVVGQRTLRAQAAALWDAYVQRSAEGASPLDAELDACRVPPRDCDLDAWKYMLLDVVLPRLRAMAPTGSAAHRSVIEWACEIAAGADRIVLLRLTLGLGQLAGDDVGLLLELSRAVLRAVPRGDDRRWSRLIERHLRELNTLARPMTEGDRARLVGWMRWIRKYVLHGNSFSAKQFGLLELVEQNHQTRTYLDALIYQTRLAQRCYDLRWETRVDDEIAELHVVEFGAAGTVAVVATVDGKLAFFDTTGRRLGIWNGAAVLDVLAPFGEGALVRTLACAVAREVVHDNILRIVLSCTGVDAPVPGVVVCEVRWSDPATGAGELIAKVVTVTCADDNARVHAVQPLPGRPYAFVVGLATRAAPVGLLELRDRRWTLRLAKDDVPCERPESDGPTHAIERPSLDPGKMPTRALGVAAVDDRAARYLIVTGSDDGLIRAISFGWADSPEDWKIRRWDRVTDAVTCVAVSRHRPSHAAHDDDGSLLSCYLGTAAGDLIALSIVESRAPYAGAAEPPFGDHVAVPLWRETHDGAVRAIALWRTPLFHADEPFPDEVLVVATEQGRLCIYNHSLDTEKERVSASTNYYFRGMRFDRVTMPDRLRALAVVSGGREFVAAGPGKRLYLGKLAYLRESVDRNDPEQRDRPPGPGLHDEMWARLHQLFAATRIDEPFEVDASRSHELKLDLCELVRLEGGSLVTYALRERLSFHRPWTALGADALRTRANELLQPLDPEDPHDAERIKVILKSLSRAFLYRNPIELRTEILAPGSAPAQRAETAAACEVVADYLTRKLAYSTRAAARLRIVAIKELLRVPALRHIAQGDREAERVRDAVESALESCLRDDDSLVRIEALRALSILLRNVGVMADAAAGDRKRLIDAVFPGGLDSVAWLLELVVAGLHRFPSVTLRSALVSGAWYHISALLPLFRLFQDRALALCDYLIRAGLGVEVLALCAQSLRHTRSFAIRSRIAHLYLIPRLDRDGYIDRHDRTRPSHQLLVKEMAVTPRAAPPGELRWHEIDDDVMAHRRIELLDHLARMWAVRAREDLTEELARFRSEGPPRDGAPLAELERVVGKLSEVAGALVEAAGHLTTPNPDESLALDRLAEIDQQHGVRAGHRSGLTTPLRTIVSGIVSAWRDVYNPPLPAEGLRIGRYQLGYRIAEGGFGSLFNVEEPPDRKDRYVIKVLRRLNTPGAAKRFLDGARFNLELSKRSADRFYIVAVTEILEKRPYLAYVMQKYDRALAAELADEKFHTRPGAVRWTELVAEHVTRALCATHDADHCHGDVKPTNILIMDEFGEPTFHLGDFDLAYASEDTIDGSIAPSRGVPECLSKKYRGDSQLARRQWEDVAALSIVLYRMLTGAMIDPEEVSLDKHIEVLRKLRGESRIEQAGEPSAKDLVKPRATAPRIVEALMCIFDTDERVFDVREFLAWISRPAEGPPRPDIDAAAVAAVAASHASAGAVRRHARSTPKHGILFLAANPMGTAPLSLYDERKEIARTLRMAEDRDNFEFHSHFAVSVVEAMRHLNELEPAIVHFSGHGGVVGLDHRGAPGARPATSRDFVDPDAVRIQLEDEQHQPQYVGPDALAEMITTAAPSARIVVLNACYSDDMARSLCSAVDCVVGMRGPVRDEAARAFAVAFYGALGSRQSVGIAVRQARIALKVLQHPDPDDPVCRTRDGIDPNQYFLPAPDASLADSSPPAPSRAAKDIVGLIVARAAAATSHDLHRSGADTRHAVEVRYERGREELQDWDHEVRTSGWTPDTWKLLGATLRTGHETIDIDPTYQHSWTFLAYVYHLIGRREFAMDCLARSHALATPGPRFPGRYYQSVKSKIDSGFPFNDAGGLPRPPPPPWFENEYRSYL